ncbi:hypothetical protein MCUN1_002002 [Malassezia cuniculi]|uniref:LIM zinc-binding domain-containing protein n=1 Tax=Malassezia cuniculi TaxID=948313 RepID=A0AAF0EYR0_9BASI|nr:hypothetical protein MCUN1_002002 [Malassezia cuniculi]
MAAAATVSSPTGDQGLGILGISPRTPQRVALPPAPRMPTAQTLPALPTAASAPALPSAPSLPGAATLPAIPSAPVLPDEPDAPALPSTPTLPATETLPDILPGMTRPRSHRRVSPGGRTPSPGPIRRSASPVRTRSPGPRSPPAARPGMPPIPIITIDGQPFDDDSVEELAGPVDTSPVTVSIGGGSAGPFQAESDGAAPAVRDGIDSMCDGCGRWIGGRLVHAMSKTWHPKCFLCTHCSTPLEHVSFYEHDGKPYCHLDFHELFSRRCYSCKTPIVDERYVTVDDHRLGGQRSYHELHFFCASCGEPFFDPKDHDEDEHTASSGADGGVRLGGRPFFIHGTHPYCGPCHERLLLVRCKACKLPIRKDAVRALGADWHPDCFVCTRCRRPFGLGAFFIGPDGSPCDFDCYQAWLKHSGQ